MSTIVARVISDAPRRTFMLRDDQDLSLYSEEGSLIVRVAPSFEALRGCFPSATIRSFSYDGIAQRWFLELPASSTTSGRGSQSPSS